MKKSQKRILLVGAKDDDCATVYDALLGIPNSPFCVDWVSNHKECLKDLEHDSYSACLVDSSLGGQSGIEVIRRVRAAGWKMPIIFLAKQDDQQIAAQAKEAGSMDVLDKEQISSILLDRCLHHIIEIACLSEAQRSSQQRYEAIANVGRDGVWDWDLKADRVFFSSRWKSILGCEEDEISDDPAEWFNRIHPNDIQKVRAEIAAHLEGLTPHLVNEHRILHKQGDYCWGLCRGLAHRDEAGNAVRLIGTLADITEAKQAEKQLRESAFSDALTGLPNRTVFKDRLGRCIERSKRRGNYMFAVLFLDLDGFKIINDSLGHMIGDQLLIAITHRLEKCLRTTDTVARLGGDEFALLLDDIGDISDALRVANRIQEDLHHPFNLSGHEVFSSASIGIVLSTRDYTSVDDFLRDADTAMYRAKGKGKTRHEIFDQDMHKRALKRLSLESDLRRAVKRNEFVVYYQPIVSLKTGRITGFEALARWQHPRQGLVPPGEFISLAEETGLIIAIDRWILREACRQLAQWQQDLSQARTLSISVNLSQKQFVREDLIDYIQESLSETGLAPEYFRPEITESQLMENVDIATAMLNRLKDMNILLHMDDFGTGYSSLSYLIRFHIDILKIDGSFTSNMDVHGESLEIVRMIINLAHNLGMTVIAEGVETAEQFKQLKTLRCEFGQGFFFSKPVDARAAQALIEADKKW